MSAGRHFPAPAAWRSIHQSSTASPQRAHLQKQTIGRLEEEQRNTVSGNTPEPSCPGKGSPQGCKRRRPGNQPSFGVTDMHARQCRAAFQIIAELGRTFAGIDPAQLIGAIASLPQGDLATTDGTSSVVVNGQCRRFGRAHAFVIPAVRARVTKDANVRCRSSDMSLFATHVLAAVIKSTASHGGRRPDHDGTSMLKEALSLDRQGSGVCGSAYQAYRVLRHIRVACRQIGDVDMARRADRLARSSENIQFEGKQFLVESERFGFERGESCLQTGISFAQLVQLTLLDLRAICGWRNRWSSLRRAFRFGQRGFG